MEAVIAERIGRLSDQWQAMLAVASVEGEEFSAEVIARVQGINEREIVRRLSGELTRHHRLVLATSCQQIGGQRLSRYRFRHHLFQKYLYNRLDAVERTHLHEAVGQALKMLYGEATNEIAAQSGVALSGSGNR